MKSKQPHKKSVKRTKRILHDVVPRRTRKVEIQSVQPVISNQQPIINHQSTQSHTLLAKGYKPFSRLRVLFAVPMALILMVAFVLPLAAFEAHVVNVTATIERKPCIEYEISSLGYWKNHQENWVLPQTLGPLVIDTVQKAT